jgi:hypothetical protein
LIIIKNDIKEIIGELTQSDHTKIKKIKRKFTKYLQGYSAGVDGTRKYHEFIRIQNEIKKQFQKDNREYRKYQRKHPFKPKSEKIFWSRYRYVGTDDLISKIQ